MSQTGSTGNTQKRPKHQKELHHCWVSERNERKTQLVLFGSLFDKCISNNGMHFATTRTVWNLAASAKLQQQTKRAVANHHGYHAIDDFYPISSNEHISNTSQKKNKGLFKKTCASSLMQTLPQTCLKQELGPEERPQELWFGWCPLKRATVHSALNAAVLPQLFQRGLHTFFLRQNYQNYSVSQTSIINAKGKKTEISSFESIHIYKSK